METEECIQQEMLETRAALAEKLETLEQKMTGTVDEMTTVVQDTVGVIKETVHEARATVQAVNESVQEGVRSVQESLDVTVHVQSHPWWAMAGSVAAGFCLGTWLRNRSEPRPIFPVEGEGVAVPPVSQGAAYEPHQMASPGVEASRWAPEIDKLKGLAVGALFGTAREMIASSLPDPVGRQVKEIIDSVTRKAGGEPIPSSAFAGLLQPRPPHANGTSPNQEWRHAVPVELGGES